MKFNWHASLLRFTKHQALLFHKTFYLSTHLHVNSVSQTLSFYLRDVLLIFSIKTQPTLATFFVFVQEISHQGKHLPPFQGVDLDYCILTTPLIVSLVIQSFYLLVQCYLLSLESFYYAEFSLLIIHVKIILSFFVQLLSVQVLFPSQTSDFFIFLFQLSNVSFDI